jgi:hypothetical protein
MPHLQAIARRIGKRCVKMNGGREDGAMVSEGDDPAAAALRLEDALERIAHAATAGIISAAAKAPRTDLAPEDRSELTARLDSLIANLRAALAGQPE